MAGTGEIVVGVDGSSGSETALRWAVRAAADRSGTVVALLGATADGLPHGAHHLSLPTGRASHSPAADDLLDQIVGRATGSAAVPVRRVVVRADPVEALAKQAATADMIVVGARGHGPVHRMLAGSVSQGIVHHAPVPVVVVHGPVAVPGEPGGDARPVVVGIDGSSASLAALRWAAIEAERRHAPLRVVHAWGGGERLDGAIMAAEQAGLVREAQRVLDDAVSAGAGEAANVDAIVARGSAAAMLLREAKDAQLLVVGSRGRGGFAELVLGSVSHQCVLYATCPVAVIRAGQPS